MKSASQLTPHEVVTELEIDFSNLAVLTPGTSRIKFLYISIFLFFSIFSILFVRVVDYPVNYIFRWGKTCFFCLITL